MLLTPGGRLVLRVEQNDGSRSGGWANHATRARSFTCDLPNHRRDVDGMGQEVVQDETDGTH